ncbi:MAG TPA: hypothetical protein VH681_07215, partial [Nitrospiraceae bacterium]
MRTRPGRVDPVVYFRIVHATQDGRIGAPQDTVPFSGCGPRVKPYQAVQASMQQATGSRAPHPLPTRMENQTRLVMNR